MIECITEFVYLIKNNDCSAESSHRINLACQRMGMLKTVCTSSELSVKTKIDVLVSCVFSQLLYVAETWDYESSRYQKTSDI